MIRTPEELKQQAIKMKLGGWTVHKCSMCGYPCGYIFNDNWDKVFYDSGCDCTTYSNEQPRSWEDLAYSYNMNQPENNKDIKKEYLDELNKTWQF